MAGAEESGDSLPYEWYKAQFTECLWYKAQFTECFLLFRISRELSSSPNAVNSVEKQSLCSDCGNNYFQMNVALL
jgi:hypothetical protein